MKQLPYRIFAAFFLWNNLVCSGPPSLKNSPVERYLCIDIRSESPQGSDLKVDEEYRQRCRVNSLAMGKLMDLIQAYRLGFDGVTFAIVRKNFEEFKRKHQDSIQSNDFLKDQSLEGSSQEEPEPGAIFDEHVRKPYVQAIIERFAIKLLASRASNK